MKDETISNGKPVLKKEPENETQGILMEVYAALQHKGYNPVNQLVGYLMSGDPTYITSFDNSRGKITRVTRDEILEELICAFIEHYGLDASAGEGK